MKLTCWKGLQTLLQALQTLRKLVCKVQKPRFSHPPAGIKEKGRVAAAEEEKRESAWQMQGRRQMFASTAAAGENLEAPL